MSHCLYSLFLLSFPSIFVVPPQRVVILEGSSRLAVRGESAGPFTEGANVTLICRAEGGRPPPVVYWFKGGPEETEVFDDSFQVLNEGMKGTSSSLVVENSLRLEKISRGDLNSVLTCKAISSNLSSTTTAQVSLDIACELFSTLLLLPRHSPLSVFRLS